MRFFTCLCVIGFIALGVAGCGSPPPIDGTTPNRSNTGPSGINGTMSAEEFLQTGYCTDKRIVDQVRDVTGRMLGRNFVIDDCALDGGFTFSYGGFIPDFAYPHVKILSSSINGWTMTSAMLASVDHSFITGAFWAPCPECAGQDHQPSQTIRWMPITVTNSLFWAPAPPPGAGPHSEALQVVGGGWGYSFSNTRFVQEGPYNGTQSGAIKFTGRDASFTNVFFDFGGTPTAAQLTVYLEGWNVSVNGCRVQRGLGGYQFPFVWSGGNGYSVPSLDSCSDFETNAGL
jgi:hypothetical protein